jgi:ABC-type nitrate/sulfonate/bicarbonate transport system permease component
MSVREAQAGAPAVTRRRSFRPQAVDWAVRLGAVGIVLVVWEFVAPAVNPLIIRPPSAIATAFGELIASGELQAATLTSLRSFSAGLAAAIVLGVFLGVATGRWRTVYNALDPLISALYSVPSVALIPLIGFAFKFQGDAPRIVSVALFCIFPVLINTQQGVRNIDRDLLEVARAFNSSERRLWRDVVIPAALPFVLAGIRLAIGRGLIGMIVAEFLIGVVGTGGLGNLIITYQNVFRIDRMFVPVIVVALLGIAFTSVVQLVEGRVAPWRRER